MRPTAILLLVLVASPGVASGLEDLAWISGQWRSVIGGVVMEESWLPPAGGIMLGMHRDVRPEGKPFFEFLRIEMDESGPVYVAQPRGREATRFPLKKSDGQRVTFENPEHDFPKRIIYWKESDRLCARVEGDEPGAAEQWCWERVAD
ncbi:MAG TPA: DUF6265 family protein [Thermoanaerobaculia bacterium]|nr:DUF6265 family protein [Thermoanaerobaculia bacterium]